MALKTRKEVREQLGTVLSSALSGAGNPAQQVFDYLPSTFDGKSPVVTILSAGLAIAEVQQFGGDWFPVYLFEIGVLVARDTDDQAALDELDLVAQKLYETLESNTGLASYWELLEYSEDSRVEPVPVGGDPYWLETTPIQIWVTP